MENNTDKQREKPNPDGTAASPQNRGPSPEEAPEETGARHFVHLHTHTEYSLLDGSNKIKEYVARVKELGMDSAAITDHGVMYGVIDFYRECKSAGINPVIGCEVYVAPGSRFDRESGRGAENDRYYHLILLAENNQGYQNLMKIVSIGFTEGYYYKPRVDKEVLRKYHEGIICTSACLAGEVQKDLARGFYEEAKSAALQYRDIFGEGNFFLELQDHGLADQKRINPLIMKLSRDTGIGLVCTNDCHYTYAEDAGAHDILLCLQTGKKLADEDRLRYEGGQYYVKSPEEMAALFPYAPQALENTYKIAHRCHVEIEFGHYKIPHYECPDGMNAWEYLNKLCREGIKQRYETVTAEIEQRLGYELNTIRNMGFVEYFLIVWDYVHYARSHGIGVGPGRGSAAGSIVAYSLGITKLDPIRYNLLFERFLNPERVSMPDIDVDFAPEGRQQVIEYVTARYGKDCVAQIVTFGTLAARGVIRDVGRVMDLPYSLCDTVAKMVPAELNITLDKALEENPEFRTLYQTDEQIHKLIDMCRRLEGLPRHTSMHAAGVVICSRPVDEFVPLSRSSDGFITTQYTMTTLEELGLLKMDFLGLRNLTVIQDAVEMAQKNHSVRIDVDNISYDEPEVYRSLWTGRTDGVFQLESGGMKSFMKQLKPASLEDLIAGISLYRPGPMDYIPRYIRGKNHPETITCKTPQLEPILRPTYGCIVYQEQVMQIVQELAGYTLGRADLVRRAMSKKKAKVMAEERQNFVYGNKEAGVPGCQANGISERTANEIYDEMADFAKYAFNKSHAACYAVVAYQTAWLKYHYPQEFMAALMTSVLDDSGKIAEYIQDCRQMKIAIQPPDINEGLSWFSVKDGAIVYGLNAIKNVGRPVIDAIVGERRRNGKFADLRNFAERMAGTDVNKRAVENFIKAGAFDCFGATRRQMMMVYQQVMDNAAREHKSSMSGQMSLFDFMAPEEKKEFSIRMPDCGEYPKEQLLAFEKEVLGIYISGHPLEDYTDLLEKNVTNRSTDFAWDEESRSAHVEDRAQAVIGGIVTNRVNRFTKKTNSPMCTLMLEDMTGSVEVLVFPQSFEKFGKLVTEDAKVLISGRVMTEDESASKLSCDRVVTFDQVPREVWVQFASMEDYLSRAGQMQQFIIEGSAAAAAAGIPARQDRINIYIRDKKAVKRLGDRSLLTLTDQILDRMRQTFGQENVKITYAKCKISNSRSW